MKNMIMLFILMVFGSIHSVRGFAQEDAFPSQVNQHSCTLLFLDQNNQFQAGAELRMPPLVTLEKTKKETLDLAKERFKFEKYKIYCREIIYKE